MPAIVTGCYRQKLYKYDEQTHIIRVYTVEEYQAGLGTDIIIEFLISASLPTVKNFRYFVAGVLLPLDAVVRGHITENLPPLLPFKSW